MKTSIVPLFRDELAMEKSSWWDRLSRKLVHARLTWLEYGEIVIRENGREYHFGEANAEFPVRVHIKIKHPSVWSDVAFGGSSGSGEAYIKGSWSCNDLVGPVRISLRNRHVLEQMDKRMNRLKALLHKVMHWLNRNTRKGSRRNIRARYDLGNEVFELFLDPTMMYSSAYYTSLNMSLEEAAVAKLDRICQKLALRPEDHVLEIGTGWGGFALHAARCYGCRVTTTTISREQYQLAQLRVRDAGLEDRVRLEDRVTLLFDDYRDLEGQYDKLVSIEMIEAIGHQYLDIYFDKCSQLSKSNGLMLLQTITIVDQRYKSALREVDFIKKFIFPGGFLPSISALCAAVAKVTDMKLFHLEDIGPHYARTLADRRRRFFSRIERVRESGCSEAFIRMWEFYFCYCEGGFIERDIGTVQVLLTKPASRREPINF